MKAEILKIFGITDILDLPGRISTILEWELKDRNKIYDQLLQINGNNISYDWFQNIYEEDFAQRKQNKQDFTPNSVGVLLSKLTGNKQGEIYEPTAGNGGLLISNFWHRKNKENYAAELHPINCWELSDRSIPILLLNLSIRGIVGTVYHGDVLTREVKSTYILTKDDDKYSLIQKIK